MANEGRFVPKASAVSAARSRSPQGHDVSQEKMLALLKAAREHSARAWAMILLAYRHGMRASEICGLNLADLDLEAGSIVIRRLKGSLQTTQPLLPHRGQPLLDECAALRSWLKARPADGSDYLFTSQKGGRLDRTQFFGPSAQRCNTLERRTGRQPRPFSPRSWACFKAKSS